MTGGLDFALLSLALLLTPGPTNTLLATAGAARGPGAALTLLPAELAGYGVAILALVTVVGAAVASQPMIALALRVACAAYLVFIGLRLWGGRLDAYVGVGDVTFRAVLITTLLNPKGIVFAFVLLPAPAAGAALLPLPYLAALAVMIPLCGLCWVLLGWRIRAHAGEDVRLSTVRRVGAGFLFLFAVLMLAGAGWGQR